MTIDTFTAVILASFLAAAVTTSGILAISRFPDWVTRNAVFFRAFAAGTLVTVSFLHLIPESSELNSAGPAYWLAGFGALYLVNRFLRLRLHHQFGLQSYNPGIIPALGIGLHSFIDGIIYTVTFNVSLFTGVLAAVGMVLHEFPEGIVVYVILQRGGFPPKKAVLYAILLAALSTPLGTLLSFPFINQLNISVLGALLAMTAGVLIYVGASHLMPEVEEENNPYAVWALLAGVLVALVAVLLGE